MKKKDIRILQKRKRKLNKRLERRQWEAQSQPMFSAKNIQYEMADRVRAINCGGIGAFHVLARNSGLIDAINRRVHLLKIHLPYHESDHVLNMAYNTLAGGTCLDDIELLPMIVKDFPDIPVVVITAREVGKPSLTKHW